LTVLLQTGVSNIIGGDVKSRLNKQAALIVYYEKPIYQARLS
jgi:hypothetical protein